MAVTVSSFTVSPSGTTVNYSISWSNFVCSINRTIVFRILDVNRNAILNPAGSAVSVNASGTHNGSFTNLYNGRFLIIASFLCNNLTQRVLVVESPAFEINSTILAPDPGDSEDPDPVTDDPDSNQDVCIPLTGSVSMGDLNVIFGRARDLSNTELSGSSNPSVAPSLFGVSFLPNNVVSPGKLRPNAISEFRGYCHVPPIEAITVSYECGSPGGEPGRIIIDYFNLAGTAQQVNRTVSGGGFVIGTFDVKPGTNVTVTVENDAVSPTGAGITILRDASLLVNQTGNPSALIKFVVNNISTYSILGTIGTGGGGGGPI